MNSVEVPSITTRQRPDEYLVEMRKYPGNLGPLIQIPGNIRGRRGYAPNIYGRGYYWFPHSPLDQDPLLVLRRAVQEFITDPSVYRSETLAIEYIPKLVKSMEDPSYTRRTVFISKRAGRKIFKNTVAPGKMIGRINPFEDFGVHSPKETELSKL